MTTKNGKISPLFLAGFLVVTFCSGIGCQREVDVSKLVCDDKKDRVCPDGYGCYMEPGKEAGECCKLDGNGKPACDFDAGAQKNPPVTTVDSRGNKDVSAPDLRKGVDSGFFDVPQSMGGSNSGGTGAGGAGGMSTGEGGAGGTTTFDPQKGTNGMGCATGLECQTGICVEKVCCERPCADSCFACRQSLTGKPDGTCAPVGGGKKDPQNLCKDETGQNQCGNDGFCDGAGSCRKIGTDHVCKTSACEGTKFVPTSTCDGKGACKPVEEVECGTAQCDRVDGCRKDCKAAADCSGNAYCNLVTEKCAIKKIDGDSCKETAECQSGFCVDGVCCKSDCKEKCKACSLTLTGQASGTCLPVKLGTDPRESCAEEPICGNDGACDGVGECRKRGSETVCSPASCNTTDNKFSLAATCNGKGMCQTPKIQECGSILCDEKEGCPAKCTAESDCAAGTYCNNGTCTLKLVPGKPCTNIKECASGNCVEGVCCDSKCDTPCYSCKKELSGENDGKCSAVISGKKDSKNSCTDERPGKKCGQDGTCNGSGACKKVDKGTACAEPVCNGAKFTPESTCDGLGNCPTPSATDCKEYPCATSGCQTSCASDKDCSGSTFCLENKCVAKLINGKACTGNNQCANGHCVSNICCFDECLPGTTCGNTGKCAAGGQKCEVALPSTPCEEAICSNSQFTPARNCDGLGKCSPAKPENCVNYGCSATGCKVQCTAVKDCASAFPFCIGSVCCSLNCLNGGTCTADGKSCNCPAGFYTGPTCETEICGARGQRCCSGICNNSADYCDGTTCAVKQLNGALCNSSLECQSSNCSNGMCCGVGNKRCGSTCIPIDTCCTAGVEGCPTGSQCQGGKCEACTNVYYRDFDIDGFGNRGNSIAACSMPIGYVTNANDCDDTAGNIKPGSKVCKDVDVLQTCGSNGVFSEATCANGCINGNCRTDGTIGKKGLVTCYQLVCSTSTHCSRLDTRSPQAQCGTLDWSRIVAGEEAIDVSCDGPNDCASNQVCCAEYFDLDVDAIHQRTFCTTSNFCATSSNASVKRWRVCDPLAPVCPSGALCELWGTSGTFVCQ